MDAYEAVKACIGWASQQGYSNVERAAIELARRSGTQAVWKDLGSYGEIIEFRQTYWRQGPGQGWEIQTNNGPVWNKANPERVLRENVFGVVE